MREIKFRGWDKEKRVMRDAESVGSIYAKTCVYDKTNGREWVMNDKLELMQYTGLKDKNGKKIFEGDIIKGFIPELANEPQRKGFVKWGSYSWIIDFELPKHAPGIGMVGFCSFRDYEVIGNIYENPELMKREHDHD